MAEKSSTFLHKHRKSLPRLHICITEEAFSRTGPRGDTSANLVQVYINRMLCQSDSSQANSARNGPHALPHPATHPAIPMLLLTYNTRSILRISPPPHKAYVHHSNLSYMPRSGAKYTPL